MSTCSILLFILFSLFEPSPRHWPPQIHGPYGKRVVDN